MSSSVHRVHAPNRLSPVTAQPAQMCIANLGNWDAAVEEVRSWPEYRPEPLRALPNRARELGLAELHYKDESQRFGRELGSFKALGAPYAVFAILRDFVEAKTSHRPSAQELRSSRFRDLTDQVTVCVATDGNQGCGLAYGARTFGCRCVAYLHSHVSPGRAEAMRALGSIVIRINGEYEDSVARAREDAEINDWRFVSSTSWRDFEEPIPRYVMNAYMVMVEEALAQLPDPRAVTHVVMQGGVGSITSRLEDPLMAPTVSGGSRSTRTADLSGYWCGRALAGHRRPGPHHAIEKVLDGHDDLAQHSGRGAKRARRTQSCGSHHLSQPRRNPPAACANMASKPTWPVKGRRQPAREPPFWAGGPSHR
jgi:hypothetical protein